MCQLKDFSVSIPVLTAQWLHQSNHIPQSGGDHVAWIMHRVRGFVLAYVWHMRTIKLLSLREHSGISASLWICSETNSSVHRNRMAAPQRCAFKSQMWSGPLNIMNADFTACLSWICNLAHIQQDFSVLEEYFCHVQFDRRNNPRFPVRKHSSSAGKSCRGPDGASFFLLSYLYNLLQW